MKTLFDLHSFLLDLEATLGEERAKQEFLVMCLKEALEEKQFVEQTEVLNAYAMLKNSTEYAEEKKRRADKLAEKKEKMND